MINSPYNGTFRVSQTQHKNHGGIDMVGIDTKEIHATVNGVVEIAGNNDPNGFGIYVRIRAENGDKYYYGHMSRVHVGVGQKVSSGDLIGVEGSTGKSTGSHCHYEVRRNGVAQNLSAISGIPNAIGTYKDSYCDMGQAKPKPQPQKTIKIKPGTWNVRNAPSMNGGVSAVITGGRTIPYYGVENGWYKIDGGYIGPKAVG